MPVTTFDGDLKGLVPVGNPCLVAGKDTPQVSQDFVLCTYYPMFLWKIKNRFEF